VTAAPPAPEPAASAAAAPPPPAVTEAAQAAPNEAARGEASDELAGLAVVRAKEPSWVEARDARGSLLLSRTLESGEAVTLNGPLPLKLVIGNATATEVTMRGKRVTLGAPNRDNVVKLELK
jgi:cytoskeleton protein RodZ